MLPAEPAPAPVTIATLPSNRMSATPHLAVVWGRRPRPPASVGDRDASGNAGAGDAGGAGARHTRPPAGRRHSGAIDGSEDAHGPTAGSPGRGGGRDRAGPVLRHA